MAFVEVPDSTMLTFMFTDLEGSTRLWQQFPEAMKSALARHDELLRAAVAGAGGRVVKSTGDGIHAVFTSEPQALAACVQGQHNLLAESWPETGPLRVRMGLHRGAAQQRAGDYFGTAVNRAARLMAAAHGGQILLSAAVAEAVAERLPAGVTLRDLGEHRLKDLLRPERVYQLLHPGLPADFPPIASLNRLPNNLPSQPTVFVGRDAELARIKSLLADDSVRLLTLIGPGGTGKTRLALQSSAEMSERFADGTYFIDLAPVRDPQAVLATIARTIGVSEKGNGAMLDDLKRQLREKHMLLLLDNFEQVTPAAVQVAELLQHSPRLKLLATSREALRVRGEHLYPVPPLGLPAGNGKTLGLDQLARIEAVQLFVERARAVRPDFALTEENAAAIVELCLRLDGLPLAIELAAARIRLFSPQALRQRLGSRLSLLRGGARDLPARQQTLRDTIEWSYELLAESEKLLFAVLSVFSGCTFEAVEAVVDEVRAADFAFDLDVMDGLVSLSDKSLVRPMDVPGGEPRLRMLETIREYAGEQLAAQPALSRAVCRAHAVYFAGFVQEQARRMAGYEREAALAALAADAQNLQIAWRYWVAAGETAYLQQMVDGLWLLYDARGWYQATIELTADLLQALSGAPATPEQAQQEIMLQTGLARALLALKGYTPEAEAAYARALKLSEGLGEIPQLFPVLRGLASYYTYRAEFSRAGHIGGKIVELAERMGNDLMRLHGYLITGTSTGFQGDVAAGLSWMARGIEMFDPDRHRSQPFQLGSNPGIVCHTASAYFLWIGGFLDQSQRLSDRAIALVRRLEHPFTLAYCRFHTGTLDLWRRELPRALEHALALREIAVEHSYPLWRTLAVILHGAALAAMGRGEQAQALLDQGLELYRGHNSPPVFWPELIGVCSEAYLRIGRPETARSLLDELISQEGGAEFFTKYPLLQLTRAKLLLLGLPAIGADQPGTETGDADRTAAGVAMLQQLSAQARSMGMLIIALEAVLALCRLDPRADSTGAHRRLLAELYAEFSEGFTAPAMQEAAAILAR